MACSRCFALGLRVPISTTRTIVWRSVGSTSVLHGKGKKEPVLRKWGLEKFPRERDATFKSLDDLADYTYLDGRPTPLTKKQLEKKEMNFNLAKRIMKLTGEMEEAKLAAVQRKQDSAQMRDGVMKSKLQPKSNEL